MTHITSLLLILCVLSVSQPVGSIYNMNRLLSHGHNNFSHMAIGYRQSYYHMLRSHINDRDNDRDKSHVSCNMHVPDAVLVLSNTKNAGLSLS